ncbi:MAG TPA: TVP38/TMEM64 family protein, partial [Thermohalobaculum sp.]|nr:TVP38/TMEM64 family protein [Thermohalobaculum sp.]
MCDVSERAGPAAAEEEGPDTAPRGWLRYAPIAVIAVGALLALTFGRDYLSWERLAENRDALIEWREENVLRAALVYVVGYAVVVAFSIPGAVWMTIAGGFVFGLVPATLLTTVAATLGAAAVFLAART